MQGGLKTGEGLLTWENRVRVIAKVNGFHDDSSDFKNNNNE